VQDRVEPVGERLVRRQRLADVGLDEREPLVVAEVSDVVLASGEEAVDGHHCRTAREQGFYQV
jgi:hypothetical protein